MRDPEGRPAAVVLGMTTNGLAIARSLGRRGIQLFLLDQPGDRPAMRTRYGCALPMPDLCAEPEVWLAKVLELVERKPNPPVLIPTGDEHVLFLAEHRLRLEASGARFRVPRLELAESLIDKWLQHELLAAHGVRLPRAAAIEGGIGGDQVVRLAEDTVGFPCVIKPRASHRWMRRRTGRKLTLAHDAAELRRAFEAMSESGEPLLLQELVPGGDRSLCGAVAVCEGGEPVALFTKQKLRQFPVGFGNGSFQVSTHDREVAELATEVLRGLRFDGMAAIEFKRDERDGRLVLIEINPRGVSGNQLAVDSGLDLPFLAYQLAQGVAAPAPSTYRAGVHYLHFPWDVLAFLALRRRGELSLGGWLRSLLRARSFALFSWRDPAPAFAYALMVLRQVRRGDLAGKLIR